jgi:hypothetical protein
MNTPSAPATRRKTTFWEKWPICERQPVCSHRAMAKFAFSGVLLASHQDFTRAWPQLHQCLIPPNGGVTFSPAKLPPLIAAIHRNRAKGLLSLKRTYK